MCPREAAQCSGGRVSHGSLASLCRCGVSRLCKCRQVWIVFESSHARRLSAIRRRSSFGRERRCGIFIGLYYEDGGYGGGGGGVSFVSHCGERGDEGCIYVWLSCAEEGEEEEVTVLEYFYFILRMYDGRRGELGDMG